VSGGQIEFILEDLLQTDSFKTSERTALWKFVAIARTFMQDQLPFWEMEPADALVDGEATLPVGLGSGRSFQLGAQVFHKPGAAYALYFPNGTNTGRLDLTKDRGHFIARWFNPREGLFEGADTTISAGDWVEPGAPPSKTEEDWVLLLKSARD